ncbi:hypothetical protein CLOM_g17555 [Closterium sp. NIES-68]|nr:hypothetical protein CLOM_g17555 [Closterium sp. NIES-68]
MQSVRSTPENPSASKSCGRRRTTNRTRRSAGDAAYAAISAAFSGGIRGIVSRFRDSVARVVGRGCGEDSKRLRWTWGAWTGWGVGMSMGGRSGAADSSLRRTWWGRGRSAAVATAMVAGAVAVAVIVHCWMDMLAQEQVRVLAASAAESSSTTLREITRLTASLKEYESRPLPGCILYVDDRTLNASHITGPWPVSSSASSDSSSSSDGSDSYPHNYMEENGENMPYWAASKIVNRAYARKHGYRFVAMDPSRYQQDRHPSWFKVLFIQEQLTCCCQWAFCIDSDAYFRFSTHQLSVESWLSQLQIDGYFDWIPKDYGASLVNQTHFPRDPATLLLPDDGDKDAVFALFPRNVDDRYSQYPHARAEALFNPDLEFINAGVSLWRRSAAAIEALRVWYREQEESEFLWQHPWEQRRLARLATFYRKNMVIVPFLELTGPDGRMVRHFWKGMDNREEVLRLAVLGSVVAHELYD